MISGPHPWHYNICCCYWGNKVNFTPPPPKKKKKKKNTTKKTQQQQQKHNNNNNNNNKKPQTPKTPPKTPNHPQDFQNSSVSSYQETCMAHDCQKHFSVLAMQATYNQTTKFNLLTSTSHGRKFEPDDA